jgi:lysophospholipid acyltransferase (LPLAT)-like uncharacterized protein
MKLRNPLMIRIVSLLMSWILRLWLGSLTYRLVSDDPRAEPKRMPRRGVYLLWHEMLLAPTYTHARQGVAALISHHADGELITQIVRMLGGQVVRGSTSKGGLSALRDMMRKGRMSHVAITPDGPRGPRRVLQPGAIYLASRSGMPLVPVGFAFRHCWRHRSWDRMAFPKPGTVAVAVAGRLIEVPPNLDREGLDRYRDIAQQALDAAQRRAEELAGADIQPAGVPAATRRPPAQPSAPVANPAT